MDLYKSILLLTVAGMLMSMTLAAPDGGENPPVPAPGYVYGGIPYGSVSGNVAEYYNKRQAPPVVHLLNYNANGAHANFVAF